MNRPTVVTRGSSSDLKTPISRRLLSAVRFTDSRCSASPESTAMLRNLYIVNGLRPRPSLTCLNNTGPGESILMAMATAASSGKSTTSDASDSTTSIARLRTEPVRSETSDPFASVWVYATMRSLSWRGALLAAGVEGHRGCRARSPVR